MIVLKDLIVMNIFIFVLIAYFQEANMISFMTIVFTAAYIYTEYFRVKKVLKIKDEECKNLKEELVSQKKYFTETLGHELKVPIIAQLRGLELLYHETIGYISGEQKELILQIKQSCKYVLDMITTILNTYKLEDEESNILYEKCNISDLLTECFEETATSAKEKNISFVYISPNNNTVFEAGRAEIKTVILRLLSNAVAYSFDNERVSVSISSDKEMLKLTVNCNGIALSEHECRTMFNSVHNCGSKYTTIGQSINMYLCKKIIDIHKGRIFAYTDGKNLNTFAFVIPRTRNAFLKKTEESYANV